jgi:hypothetical protein
VPSQHHRGKSVKKNERIDSRLIKPNEGGPTAKRGNHLRAAISHCCDWCHLPLHPCFLSPPIHLCSASSLAAAFLLFHFNPLLSLSLTCFSPINPCSVSLTQSIHLSLSLSLAFLQSTLAQSRSPNPSTSMFCSSPLFLLAGLASCSTFDSPLLCYCCCSFLFSVLTCCPSSAYRSPLAPPAAPASGQSAFPPRFALSCRNKAKQSRLLLEAERQESGGTEPRGKQDEILGEKHRRRLRRRRPGRKQCVFAHFRALNSRQTGLQLVGLH